MADTLTREQASQMPQQRRRWIDATMKDLLGGKGANLAEMSSLGPAGAAWLHHLHRSLHRLSTPTRGAIPRAYAPRKAGRVRACSPTGKTFGDAAAPPLVSVQSGARLNAGRDGHDPQQLGLNDGTVEGLAKLAGDRRFAFDSYRRFLQMYSNVVLGIDHHMFEEVLDDQKDALGYTIDTQLSAEDWEAVVAEYKALVAREAARCSARGIPNDQLLKLPAPSPPPG